MVLGVQGGGGISSKGMQVINWGVMGVMFSLLAATSVFAKEVMTNFCASMRYDGTTDDAVSEEAFAAWEMAIYGGLGVGVAPACVMGVLLFYQLGCSKSMLGSASALAAILASGLVAISFGVTVQVQLRGLFIGLLVGIVMMTVVLASGQGKISAGAILTQVGIALFLFGGLATVLGAYAISRVDPCNAHRGCLVAPAADPAAADAAASDPAAADADAVDSPFTTVCDWSCCDVKAEGTTCTEYAATDTGLCGTCQPCLIDSTITTKLWACTGTAGFLAVLGLVLFIVRFAVPVP